MLFKMANMLIVSFVVAFYCTLSSISAEREIPKEVELIQITDNSNNRGDLTKNEDLEGLCEGDIVCDKPVKEGGSDRNAITGEKFRWPKEGGLVIVPYAFAANATAEAKKQLLIAAADYAGWTCIKFVERTDQNDYINIVNKPGCWCSVGRQGGKQDLSLEKGCDIGKGLITHELMHALGFDHEHTRNDRDKYVTVRMDLIMDGKKHNMRICTHCTDLVGLPYDYKSVMHEGPRAYSRTGEDVIIPKNAEYRKLLGQRVGLSAGDIKKLNQMYKCGGITASPVKPNKGIVPSDQPFDKFSNCPDILRACSDPKDDYKVMRICPATCYGKEKGDLYDRYEICSEEANNPNKDSCTTWAAIRDHCTLSCAKQKGASGAK